MERRTWRTMQGRLRKFYIKHQAHEDGLWLVAASADTTDQLAAAIERAQARYPDQALRVVEYRRDGTRIEGDRLEPVAA